MAEAATKPETRLTTAVEVRALYEAGPATCERAVGDLTPVACIEQLSLDGELLEAIQMMARWLTKREAIWWGALCLWQARRPQLSPAAEATLRSIVQWVLEPSEEVRQVVRERLRQTKATEPVASLAMALFSSGGSLSRPGLPEVKPAPDATADLIASMLRAMAATVPNFRRDEAYQQFLRLGFEVAAGESSWEK